MSETKCIGDSYNMLVTVWSNIEFQSPIITICHKFQVTNITVTVRYNTEKSEGYLQSCMLPLVAIRFPTFGSKASFFCIMIYLTTCDARWHASYFLSWFPTQNGSQRHHYWKGFVRLIIGSERLLTDSRHTRHVIDRRYQWNLATK